MLANSTDRADIHAASATTVQFSTSTALAVRPIRLWSLSGRQAAMTALPSPVTISGSAGTKYIYASLAAPSVDAYSTAFGGILYRIMSLVLGWNRADWVAALRYLHPGDGTLIDPGHNSVVTLVMTTSATPPDTDHVPLGELIWDGAAITNLTSYEMLNSLSISAFIHGQCVLILEAGDLKLYPRDGTLLVIDGTPRVVPTAGITLSSSGLSAETTYFIYALWTGSAIVLDASTTARALHTNGVQIKLGDPTRTLVGMARTNFLGQFQDTPSARGVRSWFHDAGVSCRSAITNDRSKSNTGAYEHLSVEAELKLLTWFDEVLIATVSGSCRNSNANTATRTGIGVDSLALPENGVCINAGMPANTLMPCPVSVTQASMSEAWHQIAVLVNVAGGTGTWEGTSGPEKLLLSALSVRSRVG